LLLGTTKKIPLPAAWFFTLVVCCLHSGFYCLSAISSEVHYCLI
jgi:hypothetical protein